MILPRREFLSLVASAASPALARNVHHAFSRPVPIPVPILGCRLLDGRSLAVLIRSRSHCQNLYGP